MSETRIDIQFRLTMLSDWHIGTGAGRPGSVDRLVARDDSGLPYVPAKSLTGVWRDACERVATGLDGGSTGGWSAWVAWLFGDQPALAEKASSLRPRPAAVAIRAARMPETLARRLRPSQNGDEGRRRLRDALTFVKPGLKIDGRSGRAEDRHLRFIEMARMASVLSGEASLTLPEPSRAAALALLVAGSVLVERLGGKRRRGAGRCRLAVEGPGVPSPAEAIDWLAGHEPPPVPDANDIAAGSPPAAPEANGDGDWIGLPYELRLESPAVVAARTVGNVAETLDHVPGTLLLPHVTRALGSVGIDVRGSIARGDLRVSPATLRLDGQPGRPVPLAIQRSKTAAVDEAATVNLLVAGDTDDSGPLKAIRAGYIAGLATAGGPVNFAEVRTVARTHNVVDDEPQRPTAEVGGVYTYQAIAPTVLAGRLLIRGSLWRRIAAAPNWRDALCGPCRIGRSKKDDYGAARFDVTGEATPPVKPEVAGSRLAGWLLSDVLLRDPRLRPDPTVRGLCRALERAIDPDGGRGIRVESQPTGRAAFMRIRRTESWQQSWGLPRPSLIGLQAGSSLSLIVHGPVTSADLARVEAAGIGERTAEGYGQLSFNDPLLAVANPRFARESGADDDSSPLAAIDPGDSLHPLAAALEEQAWRVRLRQAALAVGQRFDDLLGWQHRGRNPKPTMSQLGGLRSVLAGVTDEAGAKLAIAWLDHLKANPRRLEAWPKAADSLGRVRRLLDPSNKAAVWAALGLDADGPACWPTLTADGSARLRDILWPLAVRSLLQAAIRACKRSRDDAKPRSTAEDR
jgi:CRISPR-associated protein Csx10